MVPSPVPQTNDAFVGPYRLLARIGEGGMGVVHLAEGPDGRRVAVKVLRPQIVGDEESRTRFAREIATLRSVRSPHVAEILDSDAEAALPYVVTRYVPGHSLYELVRQDGNLQVDPLLHLGDRLLAAIGDVHAAGVLHRDLKPTNVVMEGRNPILIDFGVARLAEDPRLTSTGFMIGTPGYLAPEILYGDHATTATDVHGWAATMTYAACGRSPYGSGHPMSILDRTRRGAVDVSGVPMRLRPLVSAALSTETLQRPTVREIAAALQGLRASESPTSLLSRELAETSPEVTLPWQASQLAPSPPTEVLGGDARTHDGLPTASLAPPAAPPTRPASVAPPTRVVTPLARPNAAPPVSEHGATVLRPALPARAAEPGSLRGWARLRRVVLGVAALIIVATLTPELPVIVAVLGSVAVACVAGLARGREALDRRRGIRGRHWSDAPRAVLGYPWQILRASLRALGLCLFALGVGSVVAALGVVTGAGEHRALMLGGVGAGLAVWFGPGALRIRSVLRGPVAEVSAAAGPFAVLVAASALLAVLISVTGANHPPDYAPLDRWGDPRRLDLSRLNLGDPQPSR